MNREPCFFSNSEITSTYAEPERSHLCNAEIVHFLKTEAKLSKKDEAKCKGAKPMIDCIHKTIKKVSSLKIVFQWEVFKLFRCQCPAQCKPRTNIRRSFNWWTHYITFSSSDCCHKIHGYNPLTLKLKKCCISCNNLETISVAFISISYFGIEMPFSQWRLIFFTWAKWEHTNLVCPRQYWYWVVTIDIILDVVTYVPRVPTYTLHTVWNSKIYNLQNCKLGLESSTTPSIQLTVVSTTTTSTSPSASARAVANPQASVLSMAAAADEDDDDDDMSDEDD